MHKSQIATWRRFLRSLEKTVPVVFSACALALAGCSTHGGQQVTQSRFIYPNSNVVKLGPTKASVTKVGFLIPPSLGMKDVRKVNDEAVSKVPTANLLLDYASDYTFTSYPLSIYAVTYSEEGTAARQTVGMQKLR